MTLMPDRIDVWVVQLDSPGEWPAPTPAESERAARLVTADLRRRSLRSHAAVRAVLGKYTDRPLDFACTELGKPYLPAVPDLCFNLSHSHELALIAVAWGFEVGVDVERLRPLPECLSIAERFFPPGEVEGLLEVPADSREVEFFRRWTRIEAVLKARGVGLYAAGSEPEGAWSILPLEVAEGYAGSVAAARAEISVKLENFQLGR
jgi:4'-phosphopantetheinyl transferase